ncbi:MAG: DUF4249 domain-containing protein [Paludibacter sp.]
MLRYISPLIVAACMLASCTEIIKLDINASDPQIVVEANVPASENAMVKLTKSINIDDENQFQAVGNAVVILTDDKGNSEILAEKSPGIYVTKTMKGVVGRNYSLSVKTGDKTISSTCTIPDPVSFDSLKVSVQERFGGFGNASNDTLYQVNVKYTDPVAVTNFYRFVEYINGVSTGNIHIFDDRLTEGKSIERGLFNFNRILSKGDTITIEMQCIKEPVYNYFESFGNMRMGSSTPANPYTNLTGTTLGYFNAHTVERKTVVIK